MADDEGHESYPWTRQKGESAIAYESFRLYLNMGPTRSMRKLSEATGKSQELYEMRSTKFGWVERVRAYEVFMMEAATDGAVDWITNARTETQNLADKLRHLLNERLDHNISRKEDPTIRWSTAATLLLKMQDATAAPLEDAKREADMARIETLLTKIQADAEAEAE